MVLESTFDLALLYYCQTSQDTIAVVATDDCLTQLIAPLVIKFI